MEIFKTLAEALIVAARAINVWYNAADNTKLSLVDMAHIAKAQENEAPLADDNLYYVTFPDGEICLLDMHTKSLQRLYAVNPVDLEPIVATSTPQPEPLEQVQTVVPAAQAFCTNCGSRISADVIFCTNCGTRLK